MALWGRRVLQATSSLLTDTTRRVFCNWQARRSFDLHRVGMQVHVGIADNKQAMKQLIQADADGIITSWPNHLADILVDQKKQATPETANP